MNVTPQIDASNSTTRLQVLDGWRGISILSVLACHLLPLGPKYLALNAAAGPFGMSLFFTLSGFLITVTLFDHPDWKSFLIRRACRILPLVLLYIIVSLAISGTDARYYFAHICFSINYLQQFITPLTGHLWSVCVEVHFYALAAIFVMCAGRKSLWLLPLLALAITMLRIVSGTHLSIETHLRADEILAGATLGLLHRSTALPSIRWLISKTPVSIWLLLLLASCHPGSQGFGYARPYFAMALVGKTLWETTRLSTLLRCGPLKYCGAISYALYVLHPLAAYGWLGSGHGWSLYLLRRPITFACTFGGAHLSTYFWESRWIRWGKEWSKSRAGRRAIIAPCSVVQSGSSAVTDT